MNDKFDELAKSLAQSVTRRGALRQFGLGLAGLALTTLGLENKVEADPKSFGPCLAPGTICGHNHSQGSARKCEQECCSGRYYSPTGGPFICL